MIIRMVTAAFSSTLRAIAEYSDYDDWFGDMGAGLPVVALGSALASQAGAIRCSRYGAGGTGDP